MRIEYAWAMPSAWTFEIPVIARWISRFCPDGKGWADPFCGNSKLAEQRGDLKNGTDAHDFFRGIESNSLAGVLFDPPYSMEQISRSYKEVGISSWQTNNKNGGFPSVKDNVARCVREGGIVLSFGWNSSGMGKTRDFVKTHLLVVCHGENHNDTICLAERKTRTLFDAMGEAHKEQS